MNLKHKFFSKIFNFFEIFHFNKNFITFIIDEISFDSSLEYLKKELDKKGEFKYNFIHKDKYSLNNSITTKEKLFKIFDLLIFFLIQPFKLAKSKYIFLDDNFFPIAYMNFDKNTSVIQLWHASGAFKKFGFDVTNDKNVQNLIELSSSKINYLTVTSKNLLEIYEKAFKVESEKILAFGNPKTDYYFDKIKNNNKNIKRVRNKIENKYPEIKGKKIVLYAPTFRENKKKNEDILLNFDIDLFNSYLGDQFSLLFKSHPKFKISDFQHAINVSDYKYTNELLLISDILITDYSSIMIEYAIFSRPIIFYPFDFDYYINNERDFYFDYKDVPGPIAKNTSDIINFIKKDNFDFKKIEDFIAMNYDYLDNNSSKRIVSYITSKNENN